MNFQVFFANQMVSSQRGSACIVGVMGMWARPDIREAETFSLILLAGQCVFASCALEQEEKMHCKFLRQRSDDGFVRVLDGEALWAHRRRIKSVFDDGCRTR